MTSTNFYYFSGFLSCVLIVMLLTTKLYLDNWNRFEFHKEDVRLEFVSENKSKVDEFLLKKFIIPNSRINYLNRTERFEFLNNFIDTQGYKNVSTKYNITKRQYQVLLYVAQFCFPRVCHMYRVTFSQHI